MNSKERMYWKFRNLGLMDSVYERFTLQEVRGFERKRTILVGVICFLVVAIGALTGILVLSYRS